MGHVEYLEKILLPQYEELKERYGDYNRDYDFDAFNFWSGACFGLKMAIKKLKKGVDITEKI